jgi:multidrug efflux pump subunit AcrA (membrane-fusion protein)
MQEINALVSGRIQEWYVRDGSRVRWAIPSCASSTTTPQLLERLQAEREQVMAKLTAAETALEIAQIDKRRMERLFDEGLAARREFEQARIRVEQLRSDVAQAGAELSRVDVNLSRQSVQIVRAPRDGVILRVNAGDAATFIIPGRWSRPSCRTTPSAPWSCSSTAATSPWCARARRCASSSRAGP